MKVLSTRNAGLGGRITLGTQAYVGQFPYQASSNTIMKAAYKFYYTDLGCTDNGKF